MKINKYSLFPTPVFHISEFLNSKQCDDIVDYCHTNIDEFLKYPALVGNSVSNYDPDKKTITDISQKVKSCENLSDRIYKTVCEYCENSGYKLITEDITNSWANIQYKGSILQHHSHPLSAVSGALFIKCDEYSSKLSFVNPSPYLQMMNVDMENLTEYVYGVVNFEPHAGDLIIFPSWIRHGSDGEENGSDERIILSFNVR